MILLDYGGTTDGDPVQSRRENLGSRRRGLLYRFAEGEFSARAFLESYRAHHAGIEHDLHVILKGFPDATSCAAARTLFAPLSANLIELDDAGYDIGSYLAAARQVANKRLAFLNTFSEILADDWLAHLDAALDRADVGVVGATGSWQSLASAYTAAALRLAHWLRHPVPCDPRGRKWQDPG